ncbi:hypothetical protein IAU60_006342 [Kwoniella sp. DSM 27419]
MKPTIWAGLALYTVSMLIASVVPTMNLLILFQGVGPGIAAALVAFPIIRWLPERRGPRGVFSSLEVASAECNVSLYLPRFSESLTGAEGAGLVAAFNRMKPSSAMALSSLIGSVFVLTLWGFGGNQGMPVLTPFAIAFGLATGGLTSMWFQSAHDIAGADGTKQTLLSAVIGPTIGSALFRTPKPSDNRWGSAGSPGLVAWVAASLAASAAVVVAFNRPKKAPEPEVELEQRQ